MSNDFRSIVDMDEPVVDRVRELERMLSQDGGGGNPPRGPVQGKPKKTDIVAGLVVEGWSPMKTIADTLGVSRSNLADWFKGRSSHVGLIGRPRMTSFCPPF